MKDSKYTEIQEALVELIEKDSLSLSQMQWMLDFLQGNGYVEDEEDYQLDDYTE
tara:strand:- start:701 stop:862 length:162 start_codon:yes stop_codon:yes gene_type:complete